MSDPTEDLIVRIETEVRAWETTRDDGSSGLTFEALLTEAAQALRALQQEVERLREAWSLCVEMVAAEDSLIAELIDDERYLDAMKMDFPITNRMRAMIARSALTGSAQG